MLASSFNYWNCGIVCVEPREVKAIGTKKRRSDNYVRSLKEESKKLQSFIVADTETLLRKNVHIPDVLVLQPGEDVGSQSSCI